MMKNIIWISIVIVASACGRSHDMPTSQEPKKSDVLKYAQGFSIDRKEGNVWVTVHTPYQGATKGLTYLLVPKGNPTPTHTSEDRVIQIPIESLVCTSTTHIPLLTYVDEGNTLVGFPSTDLISSATMRSRIDSGFVKDLGMDKGLNLEILASLKPDLVMGYTMSADYGQFKKIEELGVPVVINSEYLEKHPLGRAEWIKFVALFYGKEKQADSIFQQIEMNYLQTKKIVASKTNRPTVLSGIMYGDAWFLPGGRNYASTILKDAGCHYLWESDSTHGFLELGFETVFERAQEADLWIGVGTYATLDQLSAGNHRYTFFKSFQTKNVYNYDRRLGAKGGNEFLELGYLRPDIILKDLVKIGHPDVLRDHSLYFYRKLE